MNAPDNSQQHQHDLEEIETSKCESDFVINNLTTSTLNMDPDTLYIDYNDPAKWIINDVTRDYVAKHGINQNLNDDFTCSKREYPDKNRFLNKSLFVRTRINGKLQSRPWLVFSKSTGTVFCAPCRLIGSTHLSTLATIGFNDWKNAVRKLNEHENFIPHKTSTVTLIEKGKTAGKINQEIVLQLEQETNYWRNILKIIVATVRSLVIRELPLRGSEEKFGSYHSGNFIMTLELNIESVNIGLGMIVELYGSLEQYISRIRNNFEEYEGKAIQICGEMEYKKDKRRTVKRKRQFDDTMK